MPANTGTELTIKIAQVRKWERQDSTMLVYNYTVWGRGHFPIAMLCRDNCWPRLEDEAAKIVANGVEHLGERKVHLQGIKPPTRELWG
jgi:hypothetical protein